MLAKNRYLIASCGVILHLMLGSTYAWSVYRNPIIAETGWNQSSIAFAFSLAIFCLGMSAAFMGQVVDKFGPRVTGTISAILYASGNILTGVALANHSLLLLYLGYGVLGGIGLGMGFGFASLLTSPISYFLITKYDVINTFYLLGVAYFLVMLIVSQFLKFPYYSEQDTNDSHKQLSQGIGAKKALKTVEFYLLWLILFINICCLTYGTRCSWHDC